MKIVSRHFVTRSIVPRDKTPLFAFGEEGTIDSDAESGNFRMEANDSPVRRSRRLWQMNAPSKTIEEPCLDSVKPFKSRSDLNQTKLNFFTKRSDEMSCSTSAESPASQSEKSENLAPKILPPVVNRRIAFWEAQNPAFTFRRTETESEKPEKACLALQECEPELNQIEWQINELCAKINTIAQVSSRARDDFARQHARFEQQRSSKTPTALQQLPQGLRRNPKACLK